MRRLSQTHARPRNDDDSILPLINVVFLLLIFFMIAGHLTSADPFAIAPPQSESGADPDADRFLILVSRDGRLALNGEVMTEDALLRALAPDAAGMVRIKADGDVNAVQVIGLMERLRDAGLTQLQLLTIPVSE